MDRKAWTVDVDGSKHVVVLNWTYWGGARQVSVDGEVVDDSTVPMRWKSAQAVQVGGRPGIVRTKPAGKRGISPWFDVSFELDGREVPADPGPTSRWEK